MKYTQRNYRGPEDLPLVVECKRACTTSESVADYPTVSDLYELLDASVSGIRENVALLENTEGKVIAFAIAHFPYCNLYFSILPQVHDRDLEAAIIAWGVERIRAYGQRQGKPVAVGAQCRDSDSERMALLERSGFIQQSDVTLHMEHSLREAVEEPQLPEGFTMRQLAGKHEVEPYVQMHREAFGTENITVEHRLTIMNNPDYRPELDLIAVAPDGTFAAFCVCNSNQEANAKSGRSEGEVGIVGTRPQFRNRGLGRAMTLAGMQRLKAQGIETAWLRTGSWNISAQRVFASVGFRITYRILWFSKPV